MDRVEPESFGFICPCFADEFVGREALEGLESPGEVVGRDEVSKVALKLIMRVVVEALDGGVFDGAVHAFDLTVGPRVLGLGEAMVDIGEGTGVFEGMGTERLLALEHLPDIDRGPIVTTGIGEVGSVKWMPLSVSMVWTL